MPVLGAFMFNAIYKFPAYHFACQTVLTNKTWTDAYRGAGRPEATFGIERMMDELAAEVGVDPLAIREKNWIKHEEFPFTTVAGLEYDSGNYEAATAKAKEMFGYDELRAEQKRRREAGDPVQLGIGVSTFTEMCGLAPSRVLGSLDYGAGGWEHASVRMLATGKVEVVTGASAHGQGHETAFSQIVADRLGVAFEDVEVLHGDTQVVPKGLDTYGSRSLVVGGEALVRAADKVIEKAKPVAAHLLEASVDDIEFNAGTVLGRAAPTRGWRSARSPVAVFAAHNLPDGMEPSLDSDATYDPVNFYFPHGTHLCAMEVDTETGALKMRKYVCVRRHRQHHQPADRRGSGARRPGPGHRPGAVGGGGLRRRRHAGVGLVRRLPAADRGRHDQLRHRPHHDARRRPTRWAPRASARPAPSPRRRPWSTRWSTRSATSGVNDIQMPCTPERVWKAVNGAGAGGADPTEGAAMPHFSENEDGPSSTEGAGAVIPAQFDYLAPTTVEEALAALAEHGDDAKILAGGQSLLPVLRMRLNAPEMVIDLGKIESLRGVRDDGDAIVIGAMTPHAAVGQDPLVTEHALLIHKAVQHLADAQIRHRGTFGGALAHADPAGDMGAPALALGAQFVIAGAGGSRTVEADDFFVDLFETAIGEDEILTEIRIPKHTGWGAHYEKFVRVAHQWPIVAVAATVKVDGGTIAEARVGLTNMGSTPLRARGVEAALAGQPATDEAVRAAAAGAAEGTNPPSDLNGDADYRRHLAAVLTRRAVLAAAGA